MTIEDGPGLAEHQRRIRRAYEEVRQASHWFAAIAWRRLCEDTRLAEYHGVPWATIAGWLDSTTAMQLKHDLGEPKRQPVDLPQDRAIVAPKETEVVDIGDSYVGTQQSISSLQFSSQSIPQNSTDSISVTARSQGSLRGGILILAGNPHPGKNRFDEEIGAIQRETTGHFLTHVALDISLDEIPIEIDRYKPHLLHICAHVDELGVCLRGMAGHVHVDTTTIAEAIVDTVHSPDITVLNFCGSQRDATSMRNTGAVIGWPAALSEQTARVWSASFYLHWRHARPLDRCLGAANRSIANMHSEEPARQL
jgi:hypothetical protein